MPIDAVRRFGGPESERPTRAAVRPCGPGGEQAMPIHTGGRFGGPGGERSVPVYAGGHAGGLEMSGR